MPDFEFSAKSITFGALSFLIFGCSTTVTTPTNAIGASNPATKIASGMTVAEVENILGNASGMQTSTYNSDHFCKSYGYASAGLQKYFEVEYYNGVSLGYKDNQRNSNCYVEVRAEDITRHAEEVVKATKK